MYNYITRKCVLSKANYKKYQKLYIYQTKTESDNKKDYIVSLMIV